MSNTQVDVSGEVKKRATLSSLKIHDTNLVTSLNGVRVVDVGQGDCIGLLNQDDKVFCYVDFGGLNDHPEKGHRGPDPSKNRMPEKIENQYVSIILTHWDKDHFWSAYKKNSEAKNCQWIVPKQRVSPQALKFAARLNDAKRWPESIGNKTHSFPVGKDHRVIIRKCKTFDANDYNPDRNITGLAVTLIRSKDSIDEAVIILPGDCPFDEIPNLVSSLPIKAMVAYHHGSNANWNINTTNSIMKKATCALLAYSYGNNHYGHPDEKNYSPDWNAYAEKTADIRASGKFFIDMKW